MWYELRGAWGYKAGASGSPAVPKGAQILRIVVHSAAGGTVAINGGDALPVIANAAPMVLDFHHLSLVAASAAPVVFTGTDSFMIEWVNPTGT